MQKPSPHCCLFLLLGGAISLAGCAKKTDPATAAALEKLKGAWVFESVTEGGKPIEPPSDVEIIFDGLVMTIREGDKLLKHNVILDVTTTPPQLDTVVAEGETKGLTELGIYEITDAQLKLCVGPTDETAGAKAAIGKRPTDFDDTQGRLILLKRPASK